MLLCGYISEHAKIIAMDVVLRKHFFNIFAKFWSVCFRISRKYWRNVSAINKWLYGHIYYSTYPSRSTWLIKLLNVFAKGYFVCHIVMRIVSYTFKDLPKNINELLTLYVIHSNHQLHHIDFTRGERVIQDLKLLQTFKEFWRDLFKISTKKML